IRAAGLNFRVRNGIGWIPRATVTDQCWDEFTVGSLPFTGSTRPPFLQTVNSQRSTLYVGLGQCVWSGFRRAHVRAWLEGMALLCCFGLRDPPTIRSGQAARALS